MNPIPAGGREALQRQASRLRCPPFSESEPVRPELVEGRNGHSPFVPRRVRDEQPVRGVSDPKRRLLPVLTTTLLALFSISPCEAIPSLRGTTGLIVTPVAQVSAGAAAYHDGADTTFSLTRTVFLPNIEAGLTRRGGVNRIHGKVQLLPDVSAGPMLVPAVAIGIQNYQGAEPDRSHYIVASKRFGPAGWALHMGVERTEGFTRGEPVYFGGLEMPVGQSLRLKAEYDGRTEGVNLGVEFRIGGGLTVFDYYLNETPNNTGRRNLFGVGYSAKF